MSLLDKLTAEIHKNKYLSETLKAFLKDNDTDIVNDKESEIRNILSRLNSNFLKNVDKCC